MSVHMPEFLKSGYKPAIGNVERKFPLRDGSRSIPSFSVGRCDGFTKIVLMMGVVGIVKELELSEAELKDSQLQMVLASFAQIRCSYEHFENPALFFLYSLRIFFEFHCMLLQFCVVLLSHTLFFLIFHLILKNRCFLSKSLSELRNWLRLF